MTGGGQPDTFNVGLNDARLYPHALRRAVAFDELARVTGQVAEIEEKARPALLAAIPDLSDAAKAPAALGEIVKYAVAQGIPESVFQENADTITSAELLIAWKASQYDKLQEAKTRVAPKAKTGAPPVRPGVSTPRATQQQVAFKKAVDRLAQSGSIEDGAAVFRQFREGN